MGDGRRRKPGKNRGGSSSRSLESIRAEIKSLEERIEKESPKRGYAPPLHQQLAFRTLPLSDWTLRGLDTAKTTFQTMTAIQNACIPHALAGRDILGAAKTGRYAWWSRLLFFFFYFLTCDCVFAVARR